MRKTFLVLLAIAMVSTAAFAQVQVEYSLSGEATATFGVNLDGSSTLNKDGAMTGFKVVSDADLDVVFIEETTEEFGEGEVYGWMEIDEFKFELDDSAITAVSGDVSAKVYMGPAYIVVATADTDINEAEIGLNVDESIAGAGGVVGDLKRDDASLAGGTEDVQDNVVAVGFMLPDLLTVELSLASWGDWSENEYNNYEGAIFAEATVAGFTVALEAATTLRGHGGGDPNDSESLGDFGDGAFIGLGVDYSLALNDMMSLVPYVGLDVLNDSNNDEFDIEVIGGANVEWGGDDLEVFAAASDETQAGVGLEFGYSTDGSDDQDWLWVRLGFAEDGGDDGLLPVVGAAALVEFVQGSGATEGSALAFGAEVDADLGVVAPFFGVMYADISEISTPDDAGLTMKLGTDVNVIPATTFTVAWNSSDLLNDADAAVTTLDDTYVYEAAQGASDGALGTITIATKVEY